MTTIEHRCPTCADAVHSHAAGPDHVPTRRSGGALTFACRCGRVATVPTASGPGRELARLGWTFRLASS